MARKIKGTTAILTCDVTSYGKGKTVYGKKGETVTVISIRGDVAIVRGKTTFSTQVKNLIEK